MPHLQVIWWELAWTFASFHAIEFMDLHILKTLNIFVCEMITCGMILPKAFKTEHSVNCFVHEKRAHDWLASCSNFHPQFP